MQRPPILSNIDLSLADDSLVLHHVAVAAFQCKHWGKTCYTLPNAVSEQGCFNPIIMEWRWANRTLRLLKELDTRIEKSRLLNENGLHAAYLKSMRKQNIHGFNEDHWRDKFRARRAERVARRTLDSLSKINNLE